MLCYIPEIQNMLQRHNIVNHSPDAGVWRDFCPFVKAEQSMLYLLSKREIPSQMSLRIYYQNCRESSPKKGEGGRLCFPSSTVMLTHMQGKLTNGARSGSMHLTLMKNMPSDVLRLLQSIDLPFSLTSRPTPGRSRRNLAPVSTSMDAVDAFWRPKAFLLLLLCCP